MKKYLLTALLGVFGLFTAFVSADTVDGVSSSSAVHCVSFSDVDSVLGEDLNYFGGYDGFDSDSNMYSCILTNDTPVYVSVMFLQDFGNPDFLVSSNGACSSNPVGLNDGGWYFYGDSNFSESKTISGKVCFSNSLMTYTSSSEGGDSDSSPLLSGGSTVFSGIISSLGSAVSEFIPYVAYIGIGLLGAIIGFVAIKRLINRVRAKIFGTFNSRRRK